MSYFIEVNDIFVGESLEDSFANSVKPFQNSVLWTGGMEETPITAVTMYDQGEKCLLKVYISDIHLVKLDLEVTPETVFIQGQPTESSIVEGYFRCCGFESLIPIPYPIKPETCCVRVCSDGLTIQLTKQWGIPPNKIRIEALTANQINLKI